MIKRSNSSYKHVVVLHGWGSTPRRWEPFSDALQKMLPENHIHIPRIPGFDKQNPLSQPYTITDYSDWLASYLRDKNIQNPIIIGHSHGGRVALHYASHYKNISKLVLIAAAGLPSSNRLKTTLFRYVAKTGKRVLSIMSIVPNTKLFTFAQKILYKATRESDYLKATPLMKKTLVNVLHYKAEPDLRNITAPTLCIWGNQDTSTPLKNGKIINNTIQYSCLKVISGGHNIHVTHPKEIAEITAHFIKKNDH